MIIDVSKAARKREAQREPMMIVIWSLVREASSAPSSFVSLSVSAAAVGMAAGRACIGAGAGAGAGAGSGSSSLMLEERSHLRGAWEYSHPPLFP